MGRGGGRIHRAPGPSPHARAGGSPGLGITASPHRGRNIETPARSALQPLAPCRPAPRPDRQRTAGHVTPQRSSCAPSPTPPHRAAPEDADTCCPRGTACETRVPASDPSAPRGSGPIRGPLQAGLELSKGRRLPGTPVALHCYEEGDSSNGARPCGGGNVARVHSYGRRCKIASAPQRCPCHENAPGRGRVRKPPGTRAQSQRL